MKKLFLIITFTTLNFSFGQTLFVPNGLSGITSSTVSGNVGIGVSNPTSKLQITSSSLGTSGLRFTNLTSSSPSTVSNSKALSVDTYGNVVLTPVVNNIIPTINIFNSDGILNNNRIVTMNGYNLQFGINTNNPFFINGNNGKVGVGTNNPSGKFEVAHIVELNQNYSTLAEAFSQNKVLNIGYLYNGQNQDRTFKYYDLPANNQTILPEIHLALEDRNDSNRLRFSAKTGGEGQFLLSDKSQQNYFSVTENNGVSYVLSKGSDPHLAVGPNIEETSERFEVQGNSILNGKIRVGNFQSYPTTVGSVNIANYNLFVKGGILTEEVRVALANTWADYVFDKNYKLKTLPEVEQFIQTNGHLPNVPSATQVAQEGVNVGEMAKIQQEKIEELTLYIIEQNKINERQAKEIETLKVQVQLLLDKK